MANSEGTEFWPERKHQLSCVDNNGNKSEFLCLERQMSGWQ